MAGVTDAHYQKLLEAHEILEGLKKIKNHCNSCKSCDECLLYNYTELECRLKEENPVFYDLLECPECDKYGLHIFKEG